MKKEYIKILKIDKANGEISKITKERALKLIGGAFVYPKKMLENSTKEHPLNLCFSMIYKGEA